MPPLRTAPPGVLVTGKGACGGGGVVVGRGGGVIVGGGGGVIVGGGGGVIVGRGGGVIVGGGGGVVVVAGGLPASARALGQGDGTLSVAAGGTCAHDATNPAIMNPRRISAPPCVPPPAGRR